MDRVLIVMQIMALVGQFLVFTGFPLGHIVYTLLQVWPLYGLTGFFLETLVTGFVFV